MREDARRRRPCRPPFARIFATFNRYSDHQGVSDVQRETIGGEWAFPHARGSIGVRVPFFQSFQRVGGLKGHELGDMSLVFKWALTHAPDRPFSLTTGAVLTLPTEPTPTL